MGTDLHLPLLTAGESLGGGGRLGIPVRMPRPFGPSCRGDQPLGSGLGSIATAKAVLSGVGRIVETLVCDGCMVP